MIARQQLERVTLPEGGESLPFEIRIRPDVIEPRSHYVLRVHVDIDGTGSVSRGDFVSTKSHQVIVGDGDTTIEVQRVGPMTPH